ncbi:MAG: hypothetical protein COV95_00920 [Candidatus Zambryskibacteria bacterium CG11_big_fil_rev_8_21_14_0_20_40_24]|uniref:Uncharacterized protein n=1 Tax=Candidatus Zambryskibacteria bacterium CG11_big_fil_rev_8_21_14_0_20_40_24 TaxID=1975116 RepID=A0A2H0K730_9BACT|nr:MAG: hypothetical protein COV95_00920 [Candidatus Zambryskibacteria bacterium CG11_big_fil_rev_8_21_14_0_20_40_24]
MRVHFISVTAIFALVSLSGCEQYRTVDVSVEIAVYSQVGNPLLVSVDGREHNPPLDANGSDRIKFKIQVRDYCQYSNGPCYRGSVNTQVTVSALDMETNIRSRTITSFVRDNLLAEAVTFRPTDFPTQP